MFVSSVAVRLLIAVSIAMTLVTAETYDFFNVSPHKDARCHRPVFHECNTSQYDILDYKLVGWYFLTPFKSCHPLYSAGGVHNCSRNMDLPKTKQECEKYCSEPCKRDDGSDGICMLEEYCKGLKEKSTADPRPCLAYGVKCCPRGYKNPPKEISTQSPINTIKENRNASAASLPNQHQNIRHTFFHDQI